MDEQFKYPDPRKTEQLQESLTTDQQAAAQVERRVADIERTLAAARGENGIDVKWPVIRFTRQLVQDVVSATVVAGTNFFEIQDDSVYTSGTLTTPKIKVVNSTVLNDSPSIFEDIAVATGNDIYIEVAFTAEPVTITSRTVKAGTGISYGLEVTGGGVFNIKLGGVVISGNTLTPTNLRYGPIDGFIFRILGTYPVRYGLAIFPEG